MKKHVYKYAGEFILESGEVLPQLEIVYHTYGNFEPGKSRVIWVCHALTANSDVYDWWPGLFGSNDFFNEKEFFIVCANNLGSCYGTSGPLSVNPKTGKKYFDEFPQVSIRDMVKAHRLLKSHLQIDNIECLIGGSQGGQQVLEWAIEEPLCIKKIIAVATNAFHSPWGIAFNESQRLSIRADKSYYEKREDGGSEGMKAARSIALLSYRNYNSYHAKQSEEHSEKRNDFRAASYQRYQGEKLVKRFNAYSYVVLSEAMDSHQLGRGRGNAEEALKLIKSKALIISVSSDLLFPPEEQKYLAEKIPGAQYASIDSLYGHDGFLLETEQLKKIIQKFI